MAPKVTTDPDFEAQVEQVLVKAYALQTKKVKNKLKDLFFKYETSFAKDLF